MFDLCQFGLLNNKKIGRISDKWKLKILSISIHIIYIWCVFWEKIVVVVVHYMNIQPYWRPYFFGNMRGVCDDHMNKIVNIRLLLIYFSSSIQLILFQTKTLYYQSSLEEKLLIFCCCCLSIPSFENFYGQIFIHPSFCFFFSRPKLSLTMTIITIQASAYPDYLARFEWRQFFHSGSFLMMKEMSVW